MAKANGILMEPTILSNVERSERIAQFISLLCVRFFISLSHQAAMIASTPGGTTHCHHSIDRFQATGAALIVVVLQPLLLLQWLWTLVHLDILVHLLPHQSLPTLKYGSELVLVTSE